MKKDNNKYTRVLVLKGEKREKKKRERGKKGGVVNSP
jgi:hypothetical protein